MRRLLFAVSVVALMVVMLAMSVAPALARTYNFPAYKFQDASNPVYSVCYYGHPGAVQGENHAAQC